MKNIFIYYLAFTAPIGIIIWLFKSKPIDSEIILGILFFFTLIYRPYIDGKRLVEKNIIEKKEIWKMILPWKTRQYFKELYLK